MFIVILFLLNRLRDPTLLGESEAVLMDLVKDGDVVEIQNHLQVYYDKKILNLVRIYFHCKDFK